MNSVVIVNWNSGAALESCIRTLRANEPESEIIVVDNASTDSSTRFLRGGVRGVRVLCNDGNRGFAAACNIGWQASAGDPVLFLNPDTECVGNAVSTLASSLAARPECWAASGQLTDRAGKPQAGFNVCSFPTLASVAADALLIENVWAGNPWSRKYRCSGMDYSVRQEVDQPAAACLLVRRTRLEQLSGFDERFFPAWFEDVDLCRRVRQAGGRILYEPAARFVHAGGSSLRALGAEDFLLYFHANQFRYFLKHHGPYTARCVRQVVLAGLLLRAFAAAASAGGAERARTFRKARRRLRLLREWK